MSQRFPVIRTRRVRGLTTIELAMTLAVLALLATAAVPALRGFLVRAHAGSAANELVVALNLARGEALKRGRDVAVVAAGSDWSQGWAVQTVAPEIVLARHAARADGFRILGAASGDGAPADRVVFGAGGSLRLAAAYDFRLCLPAADAGASRRIAIAASGAIRSHRHSGESLAGSCG